VNPGAKKEPHKGAVGDYRSNANLPRLRSKSKGDIVTHQTITSEPTVGPDGMTDDEFFRHFDRLVEGFVRQRQIETPRGRALPANWHEMSLSGLWDVLNDPRRFATPQSVVEAVAYMLRTCGMRRLNDSWLTNRLANFSDAQIKELVAALGRMRPKYPAITDQLIAEMAKLLRGQAS
jgi:hypothetical protein